MKKGCAALFALLILATAAGADPGNECETIAKNFLNYVKSPKEILSVRSIEANGVSPNEPQVPSACLVTLKGGGYILVSTSRKLSPIKGYSLKSDFETLPENYRKYILHEMEFNVRTAESSSRTAQEIGETEKRWDFLLNYPGGRAPLEYTKNTFLLTTQWNQGYPYNKFLPELNGQKVPAGCVNIAMAQVLKYYGQPATGKGVVSYEWNGQQLKSILYRPLNWANMPNSLTGTESGHQVDETAKLIRDLAVMNETQFSLSSSPTSANIQGLVHYYGFSNSISWMDNTDTTLFSKLRAEIDAERPVLLSFPGHMTVADGYSDDPTGKTVHVNMGWGGHDDDFYYLDDVIKTTNYWFQPVLDIYCSVKPCSGEDCAGNLEAGDSIDANLISGKFDFSHDMDEFYLYLKGETTISGNRGYTNQAFYITLYDSSISVVAFDDEPLGPFSLSPGKYRLRVSLQTGTGGGYLFEGNKNYTVLVETEVMNESEKNAADASFDLAPIIFNDIKSMLLSSSPSDPVHMLIDVRDENGDPVVIQAAVSNPSAVQAVLNGNVLSIAPLPEAAGTSSAVKIRATANGKSVEKTFVVMVADQDVGYGKSFEVKGLFESQTDFNTHRAILDGSCTIQGYRGFSNQAFYISITDAGGGTIVPPTDSTIANGFERGTYHIGASLAQNPGGGGSFYEIGENDSYVVTVSCPDADESELVIASLMNIDLSGTVFQIVGDINGIGGVDLADAVIALQVLTQSTPSGIRSDYATSGIDANGDGKVGLQELGFILQTLSKLR